jgi:hypothetical protein
VDEAGMVETLIDQETSSVRVRPFPGKLYTIAGNVMTNPQGIVATVTLVSDVGRETITTGGPFQFSSKAPGPYEILIEQQPSPRGLMGAYVALALERDMTGMRINVLPMAGVSFYFQGTDGGRVMDTSAIKMLYRRVDLAGEGPAETLRMPNGSASLVQGRWQLMLMPSPAYVATEFFGCRGERPEGSRADGWNEIAVTGPCGVHMVLSNKPGGVNGTVTMGANEPAGGVPVFLEAYDEVTHKRVVDLRSTRTDMRGKYNFAGLAPGTYRLVATFEYQAPTTGDIDAMRARAFKVEEGRDQQQDLDVWVIR